jgi:hypothetical protein
MSASVDKIMDYEEGSLTASETLELFSELVRDGLAWQLQGCYGRTAARLIELGYLDKQGRILKEIGED